MYRTPTNGTLVVDLDEIVYALNAIVMPFLIPAEGATFCNRGSLWSTTVQVVSGHLCASCFPREPIIVRAEKGFRVGQIGCEATIEGRTVARKSFNAEGQTFLLATMPEIGKEMQLRFAKVRNAGRCLTK